MWQIRQLSIGLRRVRDFVTPQTMFVFFSSSRFVHGSTRYSKNGIPDQIDGIYTLFQTKMAKSIPYFRLEMLEHGTLWAAHTYMAYIWEYSPLPPSPPPPPGYRETVIIKACFHFLVGNNKCVYVGFELKL